MKDAGQITIRIHRSGECVRSAREAGRAAAMMADAYLGMAEHSANLAESFSRFARALESFPNHPGEHEYDEVSR